eukprot:m.238062 g.238062  ORF g.238062 m.238062 type:complete len:76 (+) comp19380_c0_seq4:257-484(+)
MSQSSSDEDSDEAPGYDDAAATATSRRRRNMVELAKSFLLTEAEESDEDYVGMNANGRSRHRSHAIDSFFYHARR